MPKPVRTAPPPRQKQARAKRVAIQARLMVLDAITKRFGLLSPQEEINRLKSAMYRR